MEISSSLMFDFLFVLYPTFKVKQLSGALGITVNGQEVFTDTRYTLGPEIQFDTAFIANLFTGFGYSTERQNFTVQGQLAQNVIATKRGTRFPTEIVVV